MVAIVPAASAAEAIRLLQGHGETATVIGEVRAGDGDVRVQ
jgi:phosphoribosylaminoimidazole (AIR) synthetase